jgi:hypothetical protein
MSGLNKMLAAAVQSGAANKMASCALSAGTNSLASLVTGDYGDSCQYEVSACRNVCEIGLDYLKTNATLAQSYCAPLAAKAQSVFDSVYEKCSRSDVSTQAMKAVAGLGQNAMAGVKCAQDGGKKSDACLQNPIQCMFGDANCNNPSAANSNPVCFCKYKNPNDPMCAMISKLEENPTQDMSNSSVLSAKDYNNGKDLPLSPTGPCRRQRSGLHVWKSFWQSIKLALSVMLNCRENPVTALAVAEAVSTGSSSAWISTGRRPDSRI